MYGALKTLGAKVVDNKCKGADAAKVLLRRNRPAPKEGNENVVLLNRDGHRLVRTVASNGQTRKTRLDNIGTFIKRAKPKLGITRKVSFYDLRHNFQTWARLSGEPQAVTEFMMGHLGSKLVRKYFNDGLITDDSLQSATFAVREQLFPVLPGSIKKAR